MARNGKRISWEKNKKRWKGTGNEHTFQLTQFSVYEEDRMINLQLKISSTGNRNRPGSDWNWNAIREQGNWASGNR